MHQIKENFICNQDKIRLDQFLANIKPEFTRSYFKNLIQEGLISVNNVIQKKSGFLLFQNDKVEVQYPQLKEVTDKDIKNLDVELVFEHSDFLIINKGANVLVHAPSSNSQEPTLVDWLLNKFKEISEVGSLERPGIVHRLDMDTSGLMIIPRTNQAHHEFANLFKDRRISKTYLAVVQGHTDKDGIIDFDIVRHPSIRHKMTHVPKSEKNNRKYSRSRNAYTEYKALEYFKDASLVEAKPKTGRTHQIRVHFAAIGHPLIGDSKYGKTSKLIGRHALHAKGLEFDYKGKHYFFEQEPPQDFKDLLNQLKI